MNKKHVLITLSSNDPAKLGKRKNIQSNWTAEESMQFMEYHDLIGSNWSKYPKMFGTKTENDIKNHYYSLLRETIHKIKNDDIHFVGQLCILECFYILKEIKSFFTHGELRPKKDYLKTLVEFEKLPKQQAREYYRKFVIKYPQFMKVGWQKCFQESKEFIDVELTGYKYPSRMLDSSAVVNTLKWSVEEMFNLINCIDFTPYNGCPNLIKKE